MANAIPGPPMIDSTGRHVGQGDLAVAEGSS